MMLLLVPFQLKILTTNSYLFFLSLSLFLSFFLSFSLSFSISSRKIPLHYNNYSLSSSLYLHFLYSLYHTIFSSLSLLAHCSFQLLSLLLFYIPFYLSYLSLTVLLVLVQFIIVVVVIIIIIIIIYLSLSCSSLLLSFYLWFCFSLLIIPI